MGKNGSGRGGGGSAHDRAKARVANTKQLDDSGSTKVVAETQPYPQINSGHEWQQPLNRADSIGLLGVLVGTLFVLIVPTVWYKAPALLLMCFGFAYFIWLSHWTYRIKPWKRIVIIAVVIAGLNAGIVPQFIEQWHIEHMRSELAFDASAPGLSYPDGDHYGIKWSKGFAEVRLTVTSKAQFPIQNLNLSVWAVDKGDAIAGMAQSDPEPQGCVVRRPREQLLSRLVLRGKDGSRADILECPANFVPVGQREKLDKRSRGNGKEDL